MKYLKSFDKIDEAKSVTIEGWHGSRNLITDFRFPLFLSKSMSRAASFAVHMNWNEKEGKNQYWALKGGEQGYLYHIRVENAVLSPVNTGGPKDEMLIESGDIKILKVEKVGVKKVLNQYLPYIV